MGWDLVRHSFVLLFNNFGDALKVSVGPFLILIALVFAVTAMFGVSFGQLVPGMGDPTQVSPEAAGGVFLAVLVVLVATLFVFSWVAVSWHRYVLLEEYPGLLPALSGRPIGAYIGRSLLLALILILLALPVGIILGIFAGLMLSSMVAFVIINAVLGTLFGWVWLRLAIVLPGTALGKPIPIGEAWRTSGRMSGAIMQAAFILVVLNLLTGLVFGTALGGNIIGDILNLIVTWVTMMVGISMLTTLYGHLIEGRALN